MIMKKVYGKILSVVIILGLVASVFIPFIAFVVLYIACAISDETGRIEEVCRSLFDWIVSQSICILIATILFVSYAVVKSEWRKLRGKNENSSTEQG